MATDYEALEPETFLPQADGHTYRLTAEFLDLATAERARAALRAAGIPDTHVAVLGQLGDEVRTDWGLNADERIVLGTMAERIGLGAAAGAVVGGLAGAFVNVTVAAINVDAWTTIAAAATFGLALGGTVGGVSVMRLWDSPMETHRKHPELEHALLGIESDDSGELVQAESILRDLRPVRLQALSGGDLSLAAT